MLLLLLKILFRLKKKIISKCHKIGERKNP